MRFREFGIGILVGSLGYQQGQASLPLPPSTGATNTEAPTRNTQSSPHTPLPPHLSPRRNPSPKASPTYPLSPVSRSSNGFSERTASSLTPLQPTTKSTKASPPAHTSSHLPPHIPTLLPSSSTPLSPLLALMPPSQHNSTSTRLSN